jgi:hypothetical protein
VAYVVESVATRPIQPPGRRIKRPRRRSRNNAFNPSQECDVASPRLTNATLDLAQLARSLRDGAQCLVLATEPDLDVVRPPVALDPVLTKHRLMTAIGAPRYIPTLFGGGKFEGV